LLPLSSLSPSRSGPPRDLHSFPTRRSSDLCDQPIGFLAENGRPALIGGWCWLFAQFRREIGNVDNLTGGHHSQPVADIFELAHVDRKSTRLNSSHVKISYAVFCLKKKRKKS